MKSEHPKITLLGNNAGNNLGDAAIMSAIMDAVTKELPDAEFFVPSTKPSFIDKNYGHRYNVKGINVMPWTGSVRLFGIPTFRCFAQSDVALICDGIIFGKKFFNPTFNFLITLFFLVPFAKLLNCKLICYSCGIGPFPVIGSKWAAKVVMNACDLVIMRENDSKALAREIGVTRDIPVTGDAAFINPVSGEEAAKNFAQKKGIDYSKSWLGINATKYLDSWLKSHERVDNKNELLQGLADSVNALKKDFDFVPVVFSTHPMDEPICNQLAEMIEAVVANNSEYLSHDLQAIMRKCELFVGMRFHSLVLSSAVACPIVGLVYAPKVKGYMRLLDSEKYSVELKDVAAGALTSALKDAWIERDLIRAKQQPVVDQLKLGAYNAAVQLKNRYFLKKTASEDSVVTEQAA